MPCITITPWGHHLPDPEISRAAAERSSTIRAIRESRRTQPKQRHTTWLSWSKRRQVRIAAGAAHR